MRIDTAGQHITAGCVQHPAAGGARLTDGRDPPAADYDVGRSDASGRHHGPTGHRGQEHRHPADPVSPVSVCACRSLEIVSDGNPWAITRRPPAAGRPGQRRVLSSCDYLSARHDRALTGQPADRVTSIIGVGVGVGCDNNHPNRCTEKSS